MSITSSTLNVLLAQNGYGWQERALAAERSLYEARALIDHVARICGCTEPAHAIALLKESEQVRLYALLKGDEE